MATNKHSTRVGVIEIGSRAIRLLITDYRSGAGLIIAATDSAESRLAIALGSDEDRQNEIVSSVGSLASAYIERCRTMQANRICVFGTEALRRLPASQLTRLKASIPELIVFDAEREAECSLLAAAYGTQGNGSVGEVLAIDQGAASMELALGKFSVGGLQLIATASHPLGTQPLVESLAACGGDLKPFKRELKKKIASLDLTSLQTAAEPVLFGSAATKLAWISVRRNEAERYDPRQVQGTELTVEKIDQLLGIAGDKPDFIREVIDPSRRKSTEYETVITGLMALALVLKQLKASSFKVSALGTRHGVAWQLIQAK